jgi:hypothetical protein
MNHVKPESYYTDGGENELNVSWILKCKKLEGHLRMLLQKSTFPMMMYGRM